MIGLWLGKDFPHRDLVLTNDDRSIGRCDNLGLEVLLDRLAVLSEPLGVRHDDEIPVPPKPEWNERRNEHSDKINKTSRDIQFLD